MNAITSASMLLQSVWCDRPLPIDPIWIASRLGIEVIETSLPPDVSGAIIKDEGKDPIIVLCKSDSNNRKRFTCAHEIGHYAYRVANEIDHYEYVDLRSKKSQLGSDPEEVFANQFAASLLMPEEEIKRLHIVSERTIAIHWRKIMAVSSALWATRTF